MKQIFFKSMFCNLNNLTRLFSSLSLAKNSQIQYDTFMHKDDILTFLRSGTSNNPTKQPHVLLATVSGAASTKPSMIRFFNDDVDAIDIITTKSFQININNGNPEPIICEPEIGTYGNSVGLRNPGMLIALEELKTLRAKKSVSKVLNVSLSASNPKDFITLVKAFADVADMLELNFSCPHAASGFGASIGGTLEIAESYVREITAAVPNCPVPIFVKLTPNVPNIGEIAAACVRAGADGIVAINTVGPELYIEPHAQKPILNNKLGGKGGKSGNAIFEKALSAIKSIREAVGTSVPIIGMGGVSTGKQAAEMIQAGADVVGIGSALARVRQKHWQEYLSAVKNEAAELLKGDTSVASDSEKFLSQTPRMQYREHTVTKVEYDGDVVILELDSEMDYQAGEFVFLWLPEVGEKPFTIALSKPLTFMIKQRGNFTKAVFNLKAGDKIYVRGLYGEGVPLTNAKTAILVAGGTGIAVLPKLAEHLCKKNVTIKTFVGISGTCEEGCEVAHNPQNVIEASLAQCGEFTRVIDNGVIARVLSVLENKAQNYSTSETTFYIIGPTQFFNRAAEILITKGFSKDEIYISLEKLTRCGVGLCGECSCGKKLTCQHGTFVSYREYKTQE